MTIQRIAFVETNRPHERGIYTKCNDFEPYGLGLLAGVAKNFGHEVALFQQNGKPDAKFLEEVKAFAPNTLALSAMAYNFGYSVDFAKAMKNWTNVKVILGGPHISSYPQGLEVPLTEGAVDFGIQGEADISFGQLINSLDQVNFDIPGLIYLKEEQLKINPRGQRIRRLDDIPFAVRNHAGIKTTLGKIMIPAESKQVATSVIAYSRGCPFSCTYCDSKSVWGNSVLWRSPGNVADEMQELNEKYGTNTVFFSDLTFNANPRKVHELCDELMLRNLGINWYVLARVATPDGSSPLIPEGLLEHMHAAGCRKVGIGLESVIPEIQATFKKKVPNDYVLDVVKICHDLGILAKGFLIIGDPKHESRQTVARTLDELKKIAFDEIRTSYLTPFPGSLMYTLAKEEGRLLTDDFCRFTKDEPVMHCDHLSTEELKNARKEITAGYYQSKEYTQMVENKVTRHPELAESYEEHQSFLRRADLI